MRSTIHGGVMMRSAISLYRSLHSITLSPPLLGRADLCTSANLRRLHTPLPAELNETVLAPGLLPAVARAVTRGLRIAANVRPRHVANIAAIVVTLSFCGWAQATGTASVEYAQEEPLASHALLLDATNAGQRLVVVGERGIILLSDDQGEHWRQARVPTQTTLTAVYFSDAQNGWAVGHESLILRTHDAGLTWTAVAHSAVSNIPLFAIQFFNPHLGLAVGAQGTVLVTQDGGEHWSTHTLAAGTDNHLYAIAATRDGVLYLAGEAGNAYRSIDQGASWQRLRMPQPGSYFGAIALENNAVMFYGLRGQIALSRNRGKTFESIDAGTAASLFGARVLHNGDLVLVGAGGSTLVGHAPYRSFTAVKLNVRGSILGLLPAGPHSLILYGEKGVSRVSVDALLPDANTGAGLHVESPP